jgi:exodeoxyribonuclease V alpha subunit
VDDYISKALESNALKAILTGQTDKALFREKRRQLYANVFSKSHFLLTGKPGAGKTFEAAKVIEHLHSLHESVEILAPTGKAVLRITDNLRASTNVSGIAAKTIEKYLFDNFADVMNGKRQLGLLPQTRS